jgi:dipeptidase E
VLFLTSNGITSEIIFKRIKHELITYSGKAALVTTASVGYKEKDRNVPRHAEVLEKLGLCVEVFDIEEQNPELLQEFDLIFIIGGNPFYLLDIMRNTNCKELFFRYIKDKIVIGASAGSIVFGNTLELIHKFDPQLNDDVRLTDFSGLCLTTINVCPHVLKYKDRYDRFIERIEEFEKSKHIQITRINDGQAVIVDEGFIEII